MPPRRWGMGSGGARVLPMSHPLRRRSARSTSRHTHRHGVVQEWSYRNEGLPGKPRGPQGRDSRVVLGRAGGSILRRPQLRAPPDLPLLRFDLPARVPGMRRRRGADIGFDSSGRRRQVTAPNWVPTPCPARARARSTASSRSGRWSRHSGPARCAIPHRA